LAASAAKFETKRAARDLQVAKLYLEGHTLADIARQLGMLAGHVCSAVRRVILMWKAEAVFNINEAKIIEVQHVNAIEQQAWESFRLSQRGEAIVDQATSRITAYKKLPGDKGWMNIAKDCVRARCEILGLFAPEKTESVVTVNEKFRTREQMFADIQEKIHALRPQLSKAMQTSGYSANGNGHHHSDSGTHPSN